MFPQVFDNYYLHGFAERSPWKIYRHGIIALLKSPIQLFDSIHL